MHKYLSYWHTHIVFLLAAFLFLEGPRGVFAEDSHKKEKRKAHAWPNVVLINTDDLAWSDPSCYGSTYNLTPNIDALAERGVRFTDAYSASPVCSPSRAALLTGNNPVRLHFTDIIQAGESRNSNWRSPQIRPYLPLNQITIADVLKEQGYETAHIGKWHIGGFGDAPEGTDDPQNYGFDINVAGSWQGQPPDYFHPYSLEWQDGRVFTLPGAPEGVEGDYLPARLTDKAVDFIRQDRSVPFFLHMAFFLPHTSTGDRLQAREELIEKHRERLGHDAPPVKVAYAAMMEHLDVKVGRLIDALEQEGLIDNTLIIFTSDNGGHGGKTTNLPLRGAKGQVYEGGIRVPLIMQWRGVIEPGRLVNEPVITHDIFPTLAEIAGAGVAPPYPVDGVSLVPLWNTSGRLERKALYWHFPHYRRGSAAASVVRMGHYKLIEFFDAQEPHLELYNLSDDIGEQTDLAEQKPARTRKMHEQLIQWRKDMGAQGPLALTDTE